MNVVLFQRVNPSHLSALARPEPSKTPSIEDLRQAIEDEVVEIAEELTEGRGPAQLRIKNLARRSGLPERRIRAFWYREASRIEACEVELLRRLRAANAASRIARLENELAIARAMVARDTA